jgi:hypothetical protein
MTTRKKAVPPARRKARSARGPASKTPRAKAPSKAPAAGSTALAHSIVRSALQRDAGRTVTTGAERLDAIRADYATPAGRRRLRLALIEAAKQAAPRRGPLRIDLRSAKTVADVVDRITPNIPPGSYRCPRGDYSSYRAGRCPTHHVPLISTP